MCGIAGVLNVRGEGVDPGVLSRMIATLDHRGPDGRGVWTEGPIGLAHARLSIIDLAGGAQPMTNREQSLRITFNGEIFNYLELRDELIRKGHRFQTHSDTEVILHQYEEQGEACVQSFNGQWAFALWDARRRRLILSRDRMGVRPLYYSWRDGVFTFGSEIKALFAHPGVRRVLDVRALDHLFTFWVTLPPRTMFEGVQELPPGHTLIVAGDRVEVKPYWRIEYLDESALIQDEQQCVERLLETLTEATRIRLRADVPVGAYLSGGLDSSVVSALAQRFAGARLKTFSVAFDQREFDESAHQQEVVRHLGTDHHTVRCSPGDIGRVFPALIWHTEKPVLRTAPAPLYLLSELVRQQGYKVVLTGEGSDEILGGYDIFKEAKIRRFWARQPHSRLRPRLLRRLYPYLPNIQAQPDAYLQAFFRITSEDQASPFFSHLPRWELTAKLKLLFSDDLKAELRGSDPYGELRLQLPPAFEKWDTFRKAQYLESAYLLPGYILSSQGDRPAMAHSVEGRFPFLDHRVVECAAGIPSRLKMKVLNEKFVLKRSAGHLVPSSIVQRPKQPYRAPEAASFFQEGEARWEYVAELLLPGRLRRDGIFNPAAVSRLLTKVRAGQASGIKDNMALVGILSTQLLVEHFINHSGQRAVNEQIGAGQN